jgi:hypothetical protein
MREAAYLPRKLENIFQYRCLDTMRGALGFSSVFPGFLPVYFFMDAFFGRF